MDVKDCIAHYDGLFRFETEFLQCHIYGFRMGFAVADVVASQDVGYGGGKVQIVYIFFQRVVASAAGNGQGEAAALELLEGLEDVRVEGDGARGVEDIEYPSVGLCVKVAVYLEAREEDGRDLHQSQTDHRGSFSVGAGGEAEFLDGCLGGSDDDVGGVAEGAVEVEYDDFCAHILISSVIPDLIGDLANIIKKGAYRYAPVYIWIYYITI